MPFVLANDGTQLHYNEYGQGRPLVMIHGWSFSGRFFDHNIADLAAGTRVIVVDLRGHGDSDKPERGLRVARLAQDIFDLVEALDLVDATLLGWSLGASVIWSYLELFGAHRLSAVVFVQQVPRQYYGEDWSFNHATCFDEPSLARLQAQVEDDRSRFDEHQLHTILNKPVSEEERHMLLSEMSKAPAKGRNAIMADHTRHDWRDQVPAITLPSLVLVARRDPTYPGQGPAWVGSAIARSTTVFFEESSHALFIDEATKFNKVVREFHAAAATGGD